MATTLKKSLVREQQSSAKLEPTEPAAFSIRDVDDNRLVLTLNYNGMISDCNKAGGALLGCMPSELIWQHISKLLPQLKNIALIQGQGLNPYLRFLSRADYKFDVISLKGAHLVCKVFFCEIGCMGQNFLRVIICPLTQEKVAF